jgi:hypothetical protein
MRETEFGVRLVLCPSCYVRHVHHNLSSDSRYDDNNAHTVILGQVKLTLLPPPHGLF